jgi:hypothetical protein
MAKVTTTHGKYKGVVVNTTDYKAVNRALLNRKEELERLLIKRFTMIGEECVRIARESRSYNDITGNLRSSIGYVVLQDGKPVVNGASKQYSGTKGNGEAGPAAAEALLNQLQAKFPRGIVLIVCAGMNYAAYVENVRHKDVLTTAELLMESLVRKHLTNRGIVK